MKKILLVIIFTIILVVSGCTRSDINDPFYCSEDEVCGTLCNPQEKCCYYDDCVPSLGKCKSQEYYEKNGLERRDTIKHVNWPVCNTNLK